MLSFHSVFLCILIVTFVRMKKSNTFLLCKITNLLNFYNFFKIFVNPCYNIFDYP